MEIKEAWIIIIQNLDEDCGFEGSELKEPDINEYVKRYKKAWDTLDKFFEELT